MRRRVATKLAALAALTGALMLGSHGVIEAEGLKSLRGEAAISDADVAPEPTRVQRFDELIPRSFEEQPPLTPHDVEGPRYTLTLKENKCLNCHDRPNYEEENAPKISDSHYRDEAGRDLPHISMKRYFCNQCHVPQTDTGTLVDNTFTPLAPRR
jgi:nitrate reductase (cytochrome), electron transfer subunit